ncbi:twin-arginine translocase TatA/TatE family subunit [candidate division WWE3 bacterium CG10_big_fil_rev_8_21_14_0_10_48_23]|uniref:Twin-arginine translocase TatA/TatE family subunit n=1 Tax=candidate division WWE3 bacterium CG_4_9_14_0_2_um_filter_48_10 TaxID=1975078 RepID=A0A2M8EKA9_UNCKA|nr:MAG: twin-arginine translocase TatA/TatE family subunit [candidate division WWE3 bacterium CG_4_10_14_0_2_um_filter_47_8]PJC23159.1 MAG: twin-arginine translocase TatA/TatE family subunit [candidate division WWE3 bacterium CG_4_9_14_0_2_um_filter_48_10]PJE51652.1 MAG: twin-arginine translocase TatA/TatE family subunit [candidate division WWE3 bacterium CG10_big_fil_rev_8_21_14_0_10_48_23]
MNVIGGMGTTELIFLSVFLLVFFGGKKLPELARGIGDSVREFRKAIKEE